MAVMILKNPYVSINSVNLSSYVQEAQISYKAEIKDVTAGNASGAKAKLAGFVDWTVTLKLNQDYTAATVDATLFPLVGAAAFPVEIRPTQAVAGPDNPKYTGNALLSDYDPLSGKVGDPVATGPKLEGTGTLTRATA